MGWQLTTFAARAAAALGLRQGWTGATAVGRARGFAERGTKPDAADVIARSSTRALERLDEADRFALAKAVVDLDARSRRSIDRALVSGAPPAAVIALARSWPGFTDIERQLAEDPISASPGEPIEWGTCRATQVDPTTCGAAAMAMMLMIGDPFVAVWVASGLIVAGHVPAEIGRIGSRERFRDIDSRWDALQRSLHARVTRGALGPLPWPRALGTPPWRVDVHTRFAGLRFRDVMVDDTNPADVDALIAHASAALLDGIPVPLYASGDSSKGIDAVVPRHVVLLVDRQRDGFTVYEPGTGKLLRIADDQLRGGGVHRALGNWAHASWMVIPRTRRR